MPFLRVLSKGLPTDKLRSDLRKLLDLTEDEQNRLIAYLANANNPLPTSVGDIAKVAEAVDIDASELQPKMELIWYILVNWRHSGAHLKEVADELSALGYSGQDLQRATEFFERISVVKEQFYVADVRGDIEILGLPTVDQMSLIWDIRPIFSPTEWAPRGKDSNPTSTDWLAHTNMLILEIMSSNREGRKESISVQLSEEEFEELERLVSIARKQLELIHLKRFI
jgi:hypothetical protein